VNLPPTKDGKEEVTTEQLELLRQVINEPVQLRKPTAGTLFFWCFFGILQQTTLKGWAAQVEFQK